ncbi:MAG: CapA family protein [Gammaproteobacteria bacterium]|nr:CapA family protein [Gammaproteobacteria bacterium]
MRSLLLTLCLLIACKASYATQTLVFPHSCTTGSSIVIAAVGDVILHPPLQQKGAQKGFESLWKEAIPYIKSADIAYANLEGPMAPGLNYTGFPLFNYPPSLGSALKESGFDILSTANNHALDRVSIGVDETIASLDKINMAHVGTRKLGSQQEMFYIMPYKDFKIAWISCTEHTNGITNGDNQILYCYKKNDKQWILNKIHELKNQVDAIIVAPHWGEQYQFTPNKNQIHFAHEVLNAGATVVIGSHPHVLQPLEKYLTPDGRSTFIMYSLGNFVSYQGTPKNRSTIILLFGLTKTSQGTLINGIRFVPMYMENRSDTISLKRLNKNDLAMHYISNALPMGNAIYTTDIVTNPECF